jgi:drug/metabolite transporter (DMT)-like permease
MSWGYGYVVLTLAFTVYGQLVLKWQLSGVALPNGAAEKGWFLLHLLFRPWIFSGFVSAFAASLCWMAAMTKLRLSDAYPFMSLAFVIVMFLSKPLFGEVLSTTKVFGTVVVMVGLVIISRS